MIDTAFGLLFAPEETVLRRWRLDELLRAGYPLAHALVLAADPQLDLELARHLAQVGCPARLAVRILAPDT